MKVNYWTLSCIKNPYKVIFLNVCKKILRINIKVTSVSHRVSGRRTTSDELRPLSTADECQWHAGTVTRSRVRRINSPMEIRTTIDSYIE